MLTLPALTPEMLPKLAESGVYLIEDLAELDSDELMEITGLAEDTAKDLIVKARASSWTHA